MSHATERQDDDAARAVVQSGRASLGIEFGSTRIKACLVADGPYTVLATGSHEWENHLVDGRWTYGLDEVRDGLQAAYADLAGDVQRRYGVDLEALAGVGVSAMMHGYLAFDEDGELLVPFRTWRNTSTERASAELTERLGVHIPQRWSVAHWYQAILDGETHVGHVRTLTTLAGYAHRLLTGRSVLGVGDASGMFPIDTATGGFDSRLLGRFDELAGERAPRPLADLLPEVLPAGESAGELTEAGAALLDPSGRLQAGAVASPPEGDAGTGMVATNAVVPRSGNVSVGTSVFAMVVLERPLSAVHTEIDPVATPAGDPVAMVHCNNGASELGAWAALFGRFAAAAGGERKADEVFGVLLREALHADAAAGGVVAYNTLSGEPVLGLGAGRPLVVRAPEGRLTLANLVRAELYAVFAALATGMRVLTGEGVAVDRVLAHGGLLRTEGVAERYLAAALETPVAVGGEAAEGGAWGAAVLAAFAAAGGGALAEFLDERVFAGADVRTTDPDPADVEDFGAWLERFQAGLAVEQAAVEAL